MGESEPKSAREVLLRPIPPFDRRLYEFFLHLVEFLFGRPYFLHLLLLFPSSFRFLFLLPQVFLLLFFLLVPLFLLLVLPVGPFSFPPYILIVECVDDLPSVFEVEYLEGLIEKAQMLGHVFVGLFELFTLLYDDGDQLLFFVVLDVVLDSQNSQLLDENLLQRAPFLRLYVGEVDLFYLQHQTGRVRVAAFVEGSGYGVGVLGPLVDLFHELDSVHPIDPPHVVPEKSNEIIDFIRFPVRVFQLDLFGEGVGAGGVSLLDDDFDDVLAYELFALEDRDVVDDDLGGEDMYLFFVGKVHLGDDLLNELFDFQPEVVHFLPL